MARKKKEELGDDESSSETQTWESETLEALGGYRARLVLNKCPEQDLKRLVTALLTEWAQGRVNL